jgi:hypothetical protein
MSMDGRHKTARLIGVDALGATLVLFFIVAAGGPRAAGPAVRLPVEVVGEGGTTSGATVDVPPDRAREARSLWMQIHGLTYAGMMSVRVNEGPWSPINNDTVAVAEPGKSYGGIGGGYSTLSVVLPLPAGAIVDGANIVRFRFEKSDGVASGFRIVAFNLLAANGARLLAPETFAEDDPASWHAPLSDAESIRAGEKLWLEAPLRANGLPNAPPIQARCADCHARDGRDLKYFAFSNESIEARSRFHGLTDRQGRQIASYIRTLPYPSAGRPWNPPYQPGPGLDSQPVERWAAGAGLKWVLDNDNATLPFLFASGDPDAPLVSRITKAAVHPDANLNPREIPIALQLPDWNRWLPQVHPIDAWGPAFTQSDFARTPESLRAALQSGNAGQLISSGRIVGSFDRWTNARKGMLKPMVESRGITWTAELGKKVYATQLWQLVKTWELTQEFGLEKRREWFNTVAAAAAPAATNIPNGPAAMGGSALTNEYFSGSWYALQTVLNTGGHRHRDRGPIDWVYVVGRFQDLYEVSRRPEPARLLITLIKALQSTDPRIGPEDVKQGWRPEQNVDPSLLVNSAWAPVFKALPDDVRRAATQAVLAAWLDKNQQYPVGQYFRVGLTEASYAVPAKYGNIAGGQAWTSAPLFLAAGVDPELVRRLQKWGASYTETASRFQYSPKKSGS